MALHEQCLGATSEWYTPSHVFDSLGCTFDMDVASPGAAVTPWIPAVRFLSRNSLENPWKDFIWLNPPFGNRNGIVPWLEKFFAHGNGIALTPDRTSAPWWQHFAAQTDSILFISPKLKFIGFDGKPGASPAQGTSLMAVGSRGTTALRRATDHGLGILMAKTAILLVSALLTVAPLSAQEIDETTKAWALRRAYQLNGDSMIGCRLRGDSEWSCNSIDLSGEIRNAQSGSRPDHPVAPVVEQMPTPPAKKKK